MNQKFLFLERRMKILHNNLRKFELRPTDFLFYAQKALSNTTLDQTDDTDNQSSIQIVIALLSHHNEKRKKRLWHYLTLDPSVPLKAPRASTKRRQSSLKQTAAIMSTKWVYMDVFALKRLLCYVRLGVFFIPLLRCVAVVATGEYTLVFGHLLFLQHVPSIFIFGS